MFYVGNTEAHRKEMRRQAFSPDLKTEMCRSEQSHLHWYGRETSTINTSERPESKLIKNQLVYLFKLFNDIESNYVKIYKRGVQTGQ